MTSLTFNEDQDSCCFSSRFRNNKKLRNSEIQEKTVSMQINSQKGSLAAKKQQNIKEEWKTINHKAQKTQKMSTKYEKTENTASSVKKSEKNTIRRLVNVKLDYSMDNCEQANHSKRQIAIEQVESQVYRKSQISEEDNNAIISESEILHNYFDSSEYIRAINTHNTQIKPEQPRKIKRLFKTQKH